MMQSKGYDFFACKDFIETKGLVSLNPDLLAANMSNLNYVNPLQIQKQIYPPMQVNYAYNPNVGPVGQPVMMQQPMMGQPLQRQPVRYQ